MVPGGKVRRISCYEGVLAIRWMGGFGMASSHDKYINRTHNPLTSQSQSELPLTLPKGLTSAAEGAKGGGKGPKSLLVELDERDKGQDLTGACCVV